METGAFGELLARYRRESGKSKTQLAKSELGLSASYLTKIERGERAKEKPLRREQVWHLIEALELWPPRCDRLLEAAGLSSDRDQDEELWIQSQMPFSELLVFARVMLEPDERWLSVVKMNLLERDVVYRYFTCEDLRFWSLYDSLRAAKCPEEMLKTRLECVILPKQFFLTNFAIYVKNKSAVYCCGTKVQHDKAERFYTVRETESTRLYSFLQDWRIRLNTSRPLQLDFKRIFPQDQANAGIATPITDGSSVV